MEKTLKITITVLVITALGLGYIISKSVLTTPAEVAQETVAPTPTPIVPGVSSTPSLSSDEALILKPPPAANASKEDIGRYYATVDRLAKNTDTIEIGSGCSARPLVARIKSGSKFSVTNNDIYDHSLTFDGPVYNIPSKGTQVVVAKFTHGAGVYAYVCDASSPTGKIIGVLTMTP